MVTTALRRLIVTIGPAVVIGAVAWQGDGREIFYLGSDNRLMTVPVTVQANGQRVDPGTPVPLFTIPPGSPYDITPDGRRILIDHAVGDATTPPITLILNWKPPQ